jgi:hypothetical protein
MELLQYVKMPMGILKTLEKFETSNKFKTRERILKPNKKVVWMKEKENLPHDLGSFWPISFAPPLSVACRQELAAQPNLA